MYEQIILGNCDECNVVLSEKALKEIPLKDESGNYLEFPKHKDVYDRWNNLYNKYKQEDLKPCFYIPDYDGVSYYFCETHLRQLADKVRDWKE